MRDIYVKSTDPLKFPATLHRPMAPGYYPDLKASVYRILDVPETVSDHLAVFTFNQCSVAGHTVDFHQLKKGQVVRGIGLAWDLAKET